MERFVDPLMKMDDLHPSDFREMGLTSQGNFDIAYSTLMGTSLDAYLRKFIVFFTGVWLCHFYGKQIMYLSLKRF